LQQARDVQIATLTLLVQGDVYQKIIEEVVAASTNDFEESGVGQATLNELQQVSKANAISSLLRVFRIRNERRKSSTL
jgi:hypothetical protein